VFQILKLIYPLILLLLVTASCNYEEWVDRSFLTDEPCQAPCWYGLILDQSSEEDLLDTLSELHFIDQESIRLSRGYSILGDENAVIADWGCLDPKTNLCGGAWFEHGTLKSLWYSVGYNLPYSLVVEKLGPPEYIEYGPYHPDVGGCQLLLEWPSIGISTRSIDDRTDFHCRAIEAGKGIKKNLNVGAIFFYVPEYFEAEVPGCCKRIEWPGFSEN
jgi:hypothetical protein